MRQLSDFVRSPDLPYTFCATDYTTGIENYSIVAGTPPVTIHPFGNGTFSSSSDRWSVVWVHKSTLATRSVGVAPAPSPDPWSTCSTPGVTPVIGDWGVQESELQVQSASRSTGSLTRVVWKGNR